MKKRKYRLEYLPQFYEDLVQAVKYIAETLQNPGAANRFIDHVERAILARSMAPEAYEVYPSRFEHKYPYYRIYVDQYVIYYVVIDSQQEKVMQIRRLLHHKQNRTHIV